MPVKKNNRPGWRHENPCKGKWGLSMTPADYAHRSARFYVTGEQINYKVFNYFELNDTDLTKLPDNAESTVNTHSPG